MGAAQSAELSRVTLVGERRRVELALPSGEPIGRLLPDVIRQLEDRISGDPALRQLVTADGAVLPLSGTLASAGVTDGAVLRLVRTHNAPSMPAVHDVADQVAEALDVRTWRWRPAVRRISAGLATVVLAATAAVLARGAFGMSAVALSLLGFTLLLAALSAAADRIGNRGLAATLVLTAGVLGLLAAWTAADAHAWSPEARLAAVAAALVVTLVLTGLFTPVGRGGYIGAGGVAATTAVWELTALLLDDPDRLGATLVVVSVAVLGLLPRLALMAAGLTALDDHRSHGVSVSRYGVDTALAATHRGLALATIVTAASAVGAGLLTVEVANPWTVSLTAVLAVVLVSRSRAFPLVAEVVVLLAAGTALLVRLIMLWMENADGPPYGPLALLGVTAVLPLGVLVLEPSEHVRVRLRRFADLAESAGVIVLCPLAVGVFGVYARLLNAF
ncbi:EsaB/YukD family protein [Streptomyces sp. NPDC004647]|uniref:EsaB/YukD family protein n=1 Tax=Streptomyces sp. NPDC004647 TaxID=3154671 RepID=UPI0033BFA027